MLLKLEALRNCHKRKLEITNSTEKLGSQFEARRHGGLTIAKVASRRQNQDFDMRWQLGIFIEERKAIRKFLIMDHASY